MLEACRLYLIRLKTRFWIVGSFSMLFGIEYKNGSSWNNIQRQHLYLVLPGSYFTYLQVNIYYTYLCTVLLMSHYINNSNAGNEKFSTRNLPCICTNLYTRRTCLMIKREFQCIKRLQIRSIVMLIRMEQIKNARYKATSYVYCD